LLMTASIMVSFARSANFNFHGSTSKRILKSGVLRSGGVRFQRRPAPVTTTTNKQHRQSTSNFNFQGEPQVTIGATKTNVDPSTITFPQEKEFENLNTNFNSGYTTTSQIVTSNNNVVGSSNSGINLRPRNKACQCSNGIPGAFICIKGRGCQCKCRKFVVYEPELSRQKRSDFNFGRRTEANIQSYTCDGSGCNSTLSTIRNSETPIRYGASQTYGDSPTANQVETSNNNFVGSSNAGILDTNSNSGYNTASQVVKSNNNIVGSSNAGIFLRPRNKVCQCNGMPGAFICIKGQPCKCKCQKFVVYRPELSRHKRANFNFGPRTEAYIQSNICTSSGCESTLSNIMPSESQTGSSNQTQNPIINTQTQNIPVYEGEIIVARDGIRYKAYLYNNHL